MKAPKQAWAISQKHLVADIQSLAQALGGVLHDGPLAAHQHRGNLIAACFESSEICSKPPRCHKNIDTKKK